MRDIKIHKKINTNKTAEKIEKVKVVEKVAQKQYIQPVSTNLKFRKSPWSTILFVFMTMSVACYIFLVSSTVFYAVKTSKFTFKTENLRNISTISYEKDELNVSKNQNGISYINKNSDTAITLK